MPTFKTERYSVFLNYAPTILERWMETRDNSHTGKRIEISFSLTDILSLEDIGMIILTGDLRQTQTYAEQLERISKEDEIELYFDDNDTLNDLLPLFEDRYDSVAQIVILNNSLQGFVQLLEWWLENQEKIQLYLSGAILKSERRQLLSKEIIQSGVKIIDDELDDAVSFILGASEYHT